MCRALLFENECIFICIWIDTDICRFLLIWTNTFSNSCIYSFVILVHSHACMTHHRLAWGAGWGWWNRCSRWIGEDHWDFTIWTNIFSDLDKYILWFRQMASAILTNIFVKLEKYLFILILARDIKDLSGALRMMEEVL